MIPEDTIVEPVRLIRHGVPVVDRDRPPAEWPLQDARSVLHLRPWLPKQDARSSPERKAIETATALGLSFSVDQRLREVERPWYDDNTTFIADAERYLRGDSVSGWEPHDVALARFSASAQGTVVSHGTIMSLFVAHRAGIEPVRFWRNLRMPDLWILDTEGLRRPL